MTGSCSTKSGLYLDLCSGLVAYSLPLPKVSILIQRTLAVSMQETSTVRCMLLTNMHHTSIGMKCQATYYHVLHDLGMVWLTVYVRCYGGGGGALVVQKGQEEPGSSAVLAGSWPAQRSAARRQPWRWGRICLKRMSVVQWGLFQNCLGRRLDWNSVWV